MKIFSLNKLLYTALTIAAIVGIIFVVWLFRPKSITIINGKPTEATSLSPLTGLRCSDPSKRPIAVMISSDPEARPLSGLSEADMIFEMPVTPSGITRMMAVFQCGPIPKEIGSVRSARQDFIPLARGLKAIYAHWGGEQIALEELNNHVLDNVNALLFEGTTFYRKKGTRAPHNGFTTLQLISARAINLGYSTSANLPPYPHEAKPSKANLASLTDTISTNWPSGMDVKFVYNPASGTYSRWRGEKPEIDAATRQQVSPSVVIMIETTSKFLRDQYINVQTIGRGGATIYQKGQKISATWKKPTAQDMLTFVDDSGQPIPLAPGRIWVIIDAHLQ